MTKRKASDDGKDRNFDKKPKPDPIEEDDYINVSWAPPARQAPLGSREEDPNEVDRVLAQPYAQTLYNLPWDQLQFDTTAQTPLRRAPLKSPIGSTTQNLSVKGDKNQSSEVLRKFYNDTKAKSNRKTISTYRPNAFKEHFASGDENTAIVVSRTSGDEILVLNEDNTFEVTVNGRTARLNLVRRQPSGDDVDETRLGYFIELPLDTAVTVNGRTYDNQNDDEGVQTGPFFIGPLESFAIIELLSQPVLFFRTVASLSYSVANHSPQAPDADELALRDLNHKVFAEPTDVRWIPIPPATEETPSETDDEEASRLERQEAARQEAARQEAARQEAARQEDEERRKREQEEKEDLDYSDAWTDDGKPIANPRGYLTKHLFSQDHYRELIPRVIASINDRQPEGAGFSFRHKDHIYRPGRTLIESIYHNERHVLFVVQQIPGGGLSLRVLDPMHWHSTLEDRNAIFTQARDLLLSSNWWQNIYASASDMEEDLPKSAEWAPCAQDNLPGTAYFYTILNAWALAMGLELNTAFPHSGDADLTFFTQAQRLFDLALQEALGWKLLLNFFKSNKFAKDDTKPSTVSRGLLDQSRLFDLNKRGFEALIARQSDQDSQAQDKETKVVPVVLRLKRGVTHTRAFASDSLSHAELESIAALVREGKWKFGHTAAQLRALGDQGPIPTFGPIGRQPAVGSVSQGGRAINATGSTPSGDSAHNSALYTRIATSSNPNTNTAGSDISGAKGGPIPLIPTPDTSQRDTLESSSDFDVCKHLRSELDRLIEDGSVGTTANSEHRLSQTVTDASIAGVVRAINSILPPGHGYTLVAHTGSRISSAINGNDGMNDRVILYPRQHGDHTVLLIVELENGTENPPGLAYVMDSAPWAFTRTERDELRRELQNWKPLNVTVSGSTIQQTNIPDTLTWMPSPQRTESWQSVYYTIFSAWAILLGLSLNDNFRPDTSFFPDAELVIQAAWKGVADWKLIWAFLRCTKYTASTELPISERRFQRTVRFDNEYTNLMKTKAPNNLNSTSHDIFYRHFQADAGLSHTEPFQWDDYDGENRQTHLPTLFGADNARKKVEDDVSPCEQFRRKLNALKGKGKNASDLREFRRHKSLTKGYGRWLEDYEPSLAIASVTLAVDVHQDDYSRGFACISQVSVETTRHAGLPLFSTIRPGRPLMVPVVISNHTILLVVQLNDDAEPEFSVLDSEAYHLTAEVRAQIHELAWSLLVRTRWWDHVFPEEELDQHRPAYTSWIPVSQQPSDDECGYYTIMNAWTLALGLYPDPNVTLDWTDQFFRDLQDVIHLARMGKADWSLIHTFLKCKRFILEGEVPADRRFEHTMELRDDREEWLPARLEYILAQEEVYFRNNKNSQLDAQQRSNANRMNLPEGRRHNDRFPSDKWGDDARNEFANDLARNGKISIDFTVSQLRTAHKALRNMRGEEFRQQLEAAGANNNKKKQNHDEVLTACREYLTHWHTGRDLQLSHRPRILSTETTDFYRYLFRPGFLGTTLQSDAFSSRTHNEGLDTIEVNLAISAVVEAIDRHQSELHSQKSTESLFRGGFSLSTSTAIGFMDDTASRPRRCWMMPLAIFKPGSLDRINELRKKNRKPALKIPTVTQNGIGGHHLLAVVQEESQGFEIYLYDSSPRFQGAVAEIAELVEETAKSLGWSTQNNDAEQVIFSGFERMQVPQQGRGGWQCGPHTVINAWILALGLHPNPNATFSDEMFEEFYTIARAACVGLLDWRTLVAWIFNWHLAVERRLKDVDVSRRFGFTDFYRDEGRLGERIEGIQTDEVMAASLGDAAGYDRSNNVGPAPLHAVEQDEESEDEDDRGEEEESENRGVSDREDDSEHDGSGEDDNNDIVDDYQSDTEEDSDLERFVGGGPSELRRSYDDPSTDHDGDVVMTDAGRTAAPRRSRKGKVDELWFLDGY